MLLFISLIVLLLHYRGPTHDATMPCIIKFPDITKYKKIVLVVCPHPDDEYEGWAAIEYDETPIFLILTQGEKTIHCKKISKADCKIKRINSERYFLSKMMSRTYGLLIMDLGDKNLTTSNIRPAMVSVVDKLKPYKIIVAAYYNEKPGSTIYKHQDHKALYDTMKFNTWGVPVFIRIPSCVQSKKSILFVDEMVHSKTWGDGGIGQTAYGWLRGGKWPAGESDSDNISLFTRRQDFMVIAPSKIEGRNEPR